ncbi:MAG: ester cyclase [Anaerolineales bacterium]
MPPSHNKAIIHRGYQRNLTAFPDYRVEILDIIAEGDQLVLEWTHQGTHLGVYGGLPPTGKVIRGHAISIYRLDEFLIIQLELFASLHSFVYYP